MKKPESRKFFSAKEQCPFGCRYCFAKFETFAIDQPKENLTSIKLREKEILYPTCDAEFFNDPNAISQIDYLVHETTDPILVSLSVKSPLSERRIRFLVKLNNVLSQTGRGLIKCSISLSGKYRLDEYEPRTPGYDVRLNALKSLSEAQIPTTVNLKPILPFVPIDEYGEIVDDTLKYSSAYLVGGLYLDSSSSFGKDIMEKYPQWISKREVNWLPTKPVWQYCENPDQIEAIRNLIMCADRECFDSDIDVVEHLLKYRTVSVKNDLIAVN